MNKKKLLIGIIAIFTLIVTFIGGSYNSLITKKNNFDKRNQTLMERLQSKTNYISDLITYMDNYNFDPSIIESVSINNDRLIHANSIGELYEANKILSDSIEDLILNPDKYFSGEDVTVNQLIYELSNLEMLISSSSKNYNKFARFYNKAINDFPSNIWAKMLGFEKISYFK